MKWKGIQEDSCQYRKLRMVIKTDVKITDETSTRFSAQEVQDSVKLTASLLFVIL